MAQTQDRDSPFEGSSKNNSSNVSPSSDQTEMTIDQIAHDAGVPTSTVRLYQNKGLLPPPSRRGRVGYYNAGHRDRLRLIAHLQSRGFSLAAIKEALESWNAGHSLDHLLRVSEVAPTLGRAPLRLSAAELAQRFEGVSLTQTNIQRAVTIGLIELDGSEVVIANESFADIGPAVAKLGVPVDEILDEYEALRVAVGEIADRFQGIFEQHMWKPFVDRGMTPEEIPSLTENVSRLTELATSVITTELHDRFAEFAADYMAQAQSQS